VAHPVGFGAAADSSRPRARPSQIADRIQLHVGLLEAIDTPDGFEACRATLSIDEMRRAERFVFDRHRRQYIFAHGLLRLALSDFAPEIAPSDWSLATGRYGRPFVAAPLTSVPIHFSLSHAEGCVACVVSTHAAVGVDVEQVSPRGSLMETAQSVFSPEEIEALRGLAPREAIDRFFDYWTLKEAYLKARGFGLNLPLDGFSMLISSEHIGISFRPDIADDAAKWRFTMSSPSSVHRLAIADGSGITGGLPIIGHPSRCSLLPSRSA
jgi:4'-phosphopantetheinyl transferase